jgi:hypothetical protein
VKDGKQSWHQPWRVAIPRLLVLVAAVATGFAVRFSSVPHHTVLALVTFTATFLVIGLPVWIATDRWAIHRRK